MTLRNIVDSETPYEDLIEILNILHREGPSDPKILERLSYYKLFHPSEFMQVEERVVAALGLFYKSKSHSSVYSLLMSGFGENHKEQYGSYLTPVQASIRRAIDDTQFVSISAPTSAGKSYSIRDFIAEQSGDAVVVVPSRALIAEYVNSMRRKFKENKNVMISPFVDHVFTSRQLRRIFVLTPERSKDLFSVASSLNIEVFFFDEAQVSEEEERGVVFDVMVRRVIKNFPDARLIFAHPFVENPAAQFKKHGIAGEKFSKSYDQGAVGKVSVFGHKNLKDYYFSPYFENGHHIKECIPFPSSFKEFAFNGEHTVLIYVSKASIYNGSFIKEFKEHIEGLSQVTDERALYIISTIEELLGSNSESQVSDMVALLKKGVVIHHGSVPLEVRFLVEDFIRSGFSRICFATSTLAQGINMPFDIVWLENPRITGGDLADRSLSFKNLIGRSGRLSDENVFDFGYVYTRSPVLFSERISNVYELRETSLIDEYGENVGNEDAQELLSSIRDGDFDEDKNLPMSKVDRLSQSHILISSKNFIDVIYSKHTIKEAIGGEKNIRLREHAKLNLLAIYEASLGRGLYNGEKAVFDTAISIFFLAIQGYSFREITGLRYSDISRRDEDCAGNAKFSQCANALPDSKLKNSFSVFEKGTLARNVNFDAIIYDTYDYLDKVISFSLVEVFSSAFSIYQERSGDDRASRVIELLRYGTNDRRHVLLMRYGFAPEDVQNIAPYVVSISETDIVFNDDLKNAPQHIRDMVYWYLP